MKPGTRVEILVDIWMAPAGTTGTVHTKNLSPDLISVHYDEPFQGIFDFFPGYLKAIDRVERSVEARNSDADGGDKK